MYAFGDGLLLLSVFGFVALFPTGLAFYFLRPFREFWSALSSASLVIASTGILAVILVVLASTQQSLNQTPWPVWAAFSVLRLLVAPMLAAALLLACARQKTPFF